jgi:hypothetical protein
MLIAGRSLLGSTATFVSSLLLAAACSADGLFDDLPGGDDDGDADGDGDGAGGDGSDGGPSAEVTVCASGGADHATIGEAIEAAPAGALLSVCAGTYRERLAILDKALTIRAEDGPAATIIDAGGKGVAVTVQGVGGAGVRLEGFTIRGGDHGSAGGGVRCEVSTLSLVGDVVRDNRARGGGGLYASACSVEVADSRFEGNQGADRGGGALLVNSSGEVSGSLFEQNGAVHGAGVQVVGGTVALRGNQMRSNAAGLRGGGIYLDSDALVEGNLIADNTAGWTGGGVHVVEHAPVLRGTQVRGNVSENDGGGIYLHQSRATIIDCDILENESGDDGGGLRLFESSATVEGNRISRNVADGGGGIRVSHVASLFVDNVITDNQANLGGGMDMDNDSSVVRGGLIEGNSAALGGGISAALFPWSGAAFEGVRVSRNTAGDGGGLYLENNFQPIAITGLEVVGNTASRGGGLFVRATNLTIRNTIIARNQGEGDGGGLYLGAPEPWNSPTGCPCPPTEPTVDIDFAVFHQNEAAMGGAIWTDTSGLSVGSSILSGHTSPGVVAVGPGPAWRYNDTTPASFAGMVDPTGSDGNISSDPRFVDFDSFRLRGDSPCVNAGDPAAEDPNGTRADMGRYGGPEGTP